MHDVSRVCIQATDPPWIAEDIEDEMKEIFPKAQIEKIRATKTLPPCDLLVLANSRKEFENVRSSLKDHLAARYVLLYDVRARKAVMFQTNKEADTE